MTHQFKLHDRIRAKIVDLHQEIADATSDCDSKTVPADLTDIEIALAKSSVVRQALLPEKSIFSNDDDADIITRVVPRHRIQDQTPFKKRWLLMSAQEVDMLPVCAETKAVILGAQVEFIKALRRLQLFRAYDLYQYINLWKKSS